MSSHGTYIQVNDLYLQWMGGRVGQRGVMGLNGMEWVMQRVETQ